MKFANFVYFCITRGECANAFPRVVNLGCSFLIITITKFRMLFPAVPMDFPNSKVSLIKEWSIVIVNLQFTAAGNVDLGLAIVKEEKCTF